MHLEITDPTFPSLFLPKSLKVLTQEFGLFYFLLFICSFSNRSSSCSSQNDMYSLQPTKRIYSPKNQQSKQLLFRNTPPKDLPGRCRKFPTGKSGPKRLVDLKTSCTVCNVLAQYMRDPPKGLVTASSNKSNSGEQAR